MLTLGCGVFVTNVFTESTLPERFKFVTLYETTLHKSRFLGSDWLLFIYFRSNSCDSIGKIKKIQALAECIVVYSFPWSSFNDSI